MDEQTFNDTSVWNLVLKQGSKTTRVKSSRAMYPHLLNNTQSTSGNVLLGVVYHHVDNTFRHKYGSEWWSFGTCLKEWFVVEALIPLIEMSRRKWKCIRGPVHYEHMALLCQSYHHSKIHTGSGKIVFNKDARRLYQGKGIVIGADWNLKANS